MVDIQAKEVIDKISDELKVQPSLSIPRGLSKDIQLSYEVNPLKNVLTTNETLSDGTQITIFTPKAGKRTFVTGVTLNVSKDIVSDSINSFITGVAPTGETIILMRLNYEPLTAGNINQSLAFPIPVEVKEGGNFTVRNSSGTASIDTSAIIYYYETDVQ